MLKHPVDIIVRQYCANAIEEEIQLKVDINKVYLFFNIYFNEVQKECVKRMLRVILIYIINCFFYRSIEN